MTRPAAPGSENAVAAAAGSTGPLLVGCDVGGQSLKLAVVDRGGVVVGSATRATGSDMDLAGLAEAIEAALEEVRGLRRGQGTAFALGLGVPGVLGAQGGLDGCPNLPSLRGARIAAELSAALGRPVVAENDANCAALGEGWSGAAQGVANYLHLTLGTGLGSGLVLGGQIYRGGAGHGCELGHMVVRTQGRRCACEGRGCLEAYVSETGLRVGIADAGLGLEAAVRARSERRQQGYAEALFSLAADADPAAVSLVEETVDTLGVGIASAVNILDLDVVVIGGGIGEAVLRQEARLRSAMAEALFARDASAVSLRAPAHGGLAGAVGAASLVLREAPCEASGSP